MKKTLTLILTAFFMFPVFGQDEIRKDSSTVSPGFLLPDEIEFISTVNPDLFKPITQRSLKTGIISEQAFPEVKIDIPALYYQPLEKNGIANKQFSTDFRNFNSWELANKLSLNVSSGQNIYYSIGHIRSVDAGLVYRPNDWLSLYGGVYGAGYNIRNNPFNDFGVNSSVRVALGDNVRIGFHGNYSVNASSNFRQNPIPPGMGYQTNYGGYVDVRIAGKVGMRASVVREYSPFKKRWLTYYMVSPIIYVE